MGRGSVLRHLREKQETGEKNIAISLMLFECYFLFDLTSVPFSKCLFLIHIMICYSAVDLFLGFYFSIMFYLLHIAYPYL